MSNGNSELPNIIQVTEDAILISLQLIHFDQDSEQINGINNFWPGFVGSIDTQISECLELSSLKKMGR